MRRRRVNALVLISTVGLALSPGCGRVGSQVTDLGPEVLSLQQGVLVFASGETERSMPVQAVEMDRSILLVSLRTDGNEPSSAQAAARLASDQTVIFSREAGGDATVVIVWYLIELGPGVRVQRGFAAIFDTTTSVTIEAVDLTKSFALLNFSQPGTIFDHDNLVRAELTAETTLELSASAVPAGRVVWQVVEYSHADVHHGTTELADNDISATASIPGDVDAAHSWLLYNYSAGPADPAASPAAAPWLIRGVDQGDGSLRFDRASTGVPISLSWFLVGFTDDTLVQKGEVAMPALVDSSVVDIDPVDLETSVPFGGHLGRGGRSSYDRDDLPGVAWATYSLASEAKLDLTREASSFAEADLPWSVIEF